MTLFKLEFYVWEGLLTAFMHEIKYIYLNS